MREWEAKPQGLSVQLHCLPRAASHLGSGAATGSGRAYPAAKVLPAGGRMEWRVGRRRQAVRMPKSSQGQVGPLHGEREKRSEIGEVEERRGSEREPEHSCASSGAWLFLPHKHVAPAREKEASGQGQEGPCSAPHGFLLFWAPEGWPRDCRLHRPSSLSAPSRCAHGRC